MNHEKHMKRAYDLAELGTGFVSPNPLVGAVIVKNNKIIGEGYHQYLGGPHAEVNAINNATESTKDSTMYVTLEPCAHYGKTPPCTKAIKQAGIKEVFIGIKDPNPLTAGKGIIELKNAGIKVTHGLLQNELKQQNESFLKYITTQQPFCTIKYAMTLDGKIASSTGDSKWITNSESLQYTHFLRHKHDAILVGIGTVLADNPRLTTRLQNQKSAQCKKIVVDSKGQIPLSSELLKQGDIVVATTKQIKPNIHQQLLEKNVTVLICPQSKNGLDLKYLFTKLGELGISSILVEGGSQIITSVLQGKLCDKIVAFVAPKIIGGSYSPVNELGFTKMQQAIELKKISYQVFANNIALIGYLK